MRILLTGSTGFVGSALGPRLLVEGHEIFSVCRSKSPVAFGTNVLWDGTKPITSGSFPDPADAVIHLAQSRSYRRFPADSGEMFTVNVAMTMSLLEWAARSGVKQFCLVSSGAVYEPFGRELKEDAVLAPYGFLGASKLASEIIARPFSSLFSLSILRLFFPYGPGQLHRLVPELIRRVRTGAAIKIAADGQGVRLPPTFVGDVVEVILAGLRSSWTDTVNVATPETLSIRQIATMIGQQLGIEPRFEIVQNSSPDIVPDLSRLGSRFELTRFTPFEDGLRRTILDDATTPVGSIDAEGTRGE
jgi:nucleoside-diphosphate-sugar epimerase